MTAPKFQYFVSILFILIDSIIASNSDVFCTIQETYLESRTFTEPYSEFVEITRRCGFLQLRICYDYRVERHTHLAIGHVTKTRTKTQCCQGYFKKESKCIPICLTQCINAQCTGPNNCTCDQGYEPSDQIGRCILKCKEGYKYNEDLKACASVCSVPCLNGICTELEPEVCICSSNYHKTDGICIKSECDPSITESNECYNGTCTTNGVCLCDKGFVKNDTNIKCEPVCKSCNNGTCIAPNKCICNVGFEWSTTESKCQPKCSNGCLNGICVSPDNCVCNVGYKILNSSVCAPICNETCVNSDCTSPNVCTCQKGFKQMNSTRCEVPCEKCTHGHCEVANVCRCDTGYHNNDNGECVQNECTINDTKNICKHGYCSGGVCLCDVGYKKNDSMICAPICLLGCVNGYCSEPEVCKCYEGYELRKSSNNTYNNGSNCINCTMISNSNICDPVCDSSSKEKCIGTQWDNSKAGSFSNRPSRLKLGWIIICVIVLGVVIVASSIVYRKHRQFSNNRDEVAGQPLCQDDYDCDDL